MNSKSKPVVLIILDGFGYASLSPCNPISAENMPFFFSLIARYPWTTLAASGTAVGLPAGVPGNSAVGHFTLGAGKKVEQPLTRLTRLIADDAFIHLPIIKTHFSALAAGGNALHILGLASDGGSHSRIEFINAAIKAARYYGIRKIYVHAILDGRDVAQKSAATFLEKIDAPIATIQGRLYAMDRNQNKERVQKGYNIFAIAGKAVYASWQDALADYYAQGMYDEIIPPIRLIDEIFIKQGDGCIFVNIRADREREMYALLKNNNLLSFLITGVNYMPDGLSEALCPAPLSKTTLNDFLEQKGIPIFSIAESEKYAHITYFFNGGAEKIRPNETRVIIPSDSPMTFITSPEMKAKEITDVLCKALFDCKALFYLVNYANPDMVGHTGNLQATKKALSFLDTQLEKVYETVVTQLRGTIFITGDHGNAENKCDNSPSHTLNPVYFVVAGQSTIDQNVLKGMQTVADVKDIIIKAINHS